MKTPHAHEAVEGAAWRAEVKGAAYAVVVEGAWFAVMPLATARRLGRPILEVCRPCPSTALTSVLE